MRYLLQLILISCIFYTIIAQISYTITLDQVKLLNSSYVPGYYNVTTFRVAKYNRTTFVFNFYGEILTDIDDAVFFQAELYYSRLNNNQYYLTPGRIPKMTYYTFLNKFYRNVLMEGLKNTSNLPQLKPNENGCPQKKVSYKVI